MRIDFVKKACIVLCALVFALFSTLSLADAKQWYVIKDKHGHCKVIQAKEKTPKTIAGPYSKKDEALKEKDKLCPKKK